MKLKAYLLCLVLAASPAAALTCVPPSVEMAFTAANEAAELYVPVLGTFTGFLQRPDSDTINGRDRQIGARFRGHAISARGTGRALDVPVTITEQCLGAWCPAFAPDQQVLTFLRRDGAQYFFQVNACHGNYFANPAAEQLDALRGCLKARTCDQG